MWCTLGCRVGFSLLPSHCQDGLSVGLNRNNPGGRVRTDTHRPGLTHLVCSELHHNVVDYGGGNGLRFDLGH